MANKFDTIKTFITANPGATWWVEEVLFRGAEGAGGGTIKGAHVIVGVRFAEPDGDVRVRTFGPYPVNDLPSGITMAQTLQAIRISQQNTIEQQNVTLAANVTELANRQAVIDAKTAEAAAKQATIDQQATDIAVKQAEIDRLTAQGAATESANVAEK